ncbi:hypothetical protein [Nocardia phage KYD2]|nr:hypothetical protein [Nocardia phage KYD2]
MTTIQGVLSGQRCHVCKGAVRWRNAGFGERPSHIWAQDFADARGKTHPVILEQGEPTHYWSPGRDGGPDVKVMEGTGDRVEERHVQGPRTDDIVSVPLPVITEADLADVPPMTGWQPTGELVKEWDHPEAPGAYAANPPLTQEGHTDGE